MTGKKVPLCLTSALLLWAAQAVHATVIAQWTFETSNPNVDNSTTAGPYAAEAGVNAAGSFASGAHASSATDYSWPAGNGSARSFSSNTWAVGDFYQFTTSTTGYNSIKVEWDQTGSATGPRDFVLQYSTNGTVFTTFGSQYTVLLNGAPNLSWSVGAGVQAAYHYLVDLTSVSALDNASTIYIRLTVDSGTAINGSPIAAGGTGRVDNVTISGVPEPATLLLGALSLVGLVLPARSRRQAV